MQEICRLSDAEMEAIKEGVADIAAGRVYSSNAARIKVRELLGDRIAREEYKK